MFRSHSDHFQGAHISLIKVTDFKKEYMSSLKMI